MQHLLPKDLLVLVSVKPLGCVVPLQRWIEFWRNRQHKQKQLNFSQTFENFEIISRLIKKEKHAEMIVCKLWTHQVMEQEISIKAILRRSIMLFSVRTKYIVSIQNGGRKIYRN